MKTENRTRKRFAFLPIKVTYIKPLLYKDIEFKHTAWLTFYFENQIYFSSIKKWQTIKRYKYFTL